MSCLWSGGSTLVQIPRITQCRYTGPRVTPGHRPMTREGQRQSRCLPWTQPTQFNPQHCLWPSEPQPPSPQHLTLTWERFRVALDCRQPQLPRAAEGCSREKAPGSAAFCTSPRPQHRQNKPCQRVSLSLPAHSTPPQPRSVPQGWPQCLWGTGVGWVTLAVLRVLLQCQRRKLRWHMQGKCPTQYTFSMAFAAFCLHLPV